MTTQRSMEQRPGIRSVHRTRNDVSMVADRHNDSTNRHHHHDHHHRTAAGAAIVATTSVSAQCHPSRSAASCYKEDDSSSEVQSPARTPRRRQPTGTSGGLLPAPPAYCPDSTTTTTANTTSLPSLLGENDDAARRKFYELLPVQHHAHILNLEECGFLNDDAMMGVLVRELVSDEQQQNPNSKHRWEHVQLSRNYEISEAGLSRLIEQLAYAHHLRRLDLALIPRLTNQSMVNLGHVLPFSTLTHLDIRYNPAISASGYAALLDGIPSSGLHGLELTSFATPGLAQLLAEFLCRSESRSCPLRSLQLGGLTNTELKQVLLGLTQPSKWDQMITHLDLQRCCFDHEGLVALAQALPNIYSIQHLQVSISSSKSGHVLKALTLFLDQMQRNQSLTKVDIDVKHTCNMASTDWARINEIQQSIIRLATTRLNMTIG